MVIQEPEERFASVTDRWRATPSVQDVLSDESFAVIADRWLPLIYRGAIEYAIPGKFDAEDLVQEGLQLLYTEIRSRVVNLQMWEVTSGDFEKYFKSALFHRFVDLKRTQSTKKRNHKMEVYVTDDFDPFDSLMIAAFDNPEIELMSNGVYTSLMDRLSEPHQRVLECLVHPPEALLTAIREHRCPQCLFSGDPTSDGKCPLCIEAGFETPADLEPMNSPSRILQSEIQSYLGMKRMTVSSAISEIRQTIKLLGTTPDRICLRSFMALFSYGDIVDDDGRQVHVPWPMASSCRFEEGTPSKYHLTYYSLRDIFGVEETRLLDFMVTHTTEYYASIRFTDLSRRMNMSVHRIREAVDSIRVKLEFIDAGVPLKDIPKVF